MIIFFEGLSCSGKTSLIQALSNYDNEIKIVPEFVLKTDKSIKINTIFCWKNDFAKAFLAKKLDGKNRLILVDRGHASTLAYNYIQLKENVANKYATTINWYVEGIKNGRLIKPDLYVYMDVSADTSLSNAKKLQREDKKFAWYLNPQYGINFYKIFFSSMEPEVPVIMINGNSSLDSQIKIFYKGIQK